MVQDKGSLIKQKQRLCVDQKKTKDVFSTPHQQVTSCHFLGRRVSVHVAFADVVITDAPSSFLLDLFLGMEYLFCQFVSAILAMWHPSPTGE